MSKALSLPGNLGFLEELFCFKYDLLGVPENGVHPADDEYEKDYIWGLAPLKKVPENGGGNHPNKGDNFIVGGLVHRGRGRVECRLGFSAQNPSDPKDTLTVGAEIVAMLLSPIGLSPASKLPHITKWKSIIPWRACSER